MPKPTKDDTPRTTALEDVVRGIRKAAALKAALELEIFARIAEGNRSIPSLLKATGLSERGTRVLLDALVNINLLNRSAFEYSLSPIADYYLVKGKPNYYGDALLTQMAWDARGQTARAVKSGKPLAALTGDLAPRLVSTTSAWVDWQTVAQEFDSVWEQLEFGQPMASDTRVLVLGAEGAVRSLPLVQRYDLKRVIIVDSEPSLLPLRALLDSLPEKGSYELLQGDWLSLTFPSESFNLILIDGVTAGRSMEQNIGILHRAYECLEMGGRIVLRAPIADDDRKGPGVIPLFGLDLLIASGEGDTYTATEYKGMLEAAGFFEVKQIGDKPGIATARRTPPPPPPPPSATVAPDFIPPPETLT